MVTFKTFDEALEKSHPSKDIEHEITYWITERMTLNQWIELDELMSSVLTKVLGDGNYMGVAGPIPYPAGSAQNDTIDHEED